MRPRSTFDSVGRRNTRIEVHRVDERNAWMQLGQFDDTQELGSTDLMRLRGLVSKLRWIDCIVLANWPEEA